MVVSGRNETELKRLVECCKKEYLNFDVHYKVAEATSESDAKELVKFTLEKFGKIDILILAAGVSAHTRFSDMENIEIFRKIIDVNLMGYVNLTRHALEPIRASKGQIVVISSVSGVIGLPARTPYCASKFAVTGFFKSLQYEEQEIDISLIYPPTITGTNFRKNSLSGPKSQDSEKPSSL